jgi:hypothetical protein
MNAMSKLHSQGIVFALLILLFSPALILALLVHAIIRVWESHRDGPRRRPSHESASVLLIPWLVLPVLVLVWALVLLIALATICYRLFIAH